MSTTDETVGLWLAINLAQKSVLHELEEKLKAAGYPPVAWFDVLWHLEFSPDGARPFELTEKLLFEQSNLSRLLVRMEKSGLVRHSRLQSDGRGKIMKITKEGRKVARQMWQVYAGVLASTVGKIDLVQNPAVLTKVLKSLAPQQQLDLYPWPDDAPEE